MSIEKEIKCINKSDRSDKHDSITSVGGTNLDGTPWKLSQQQAITNIEKGTHTFFVYRDDVKTNVIIATSDNGHKYLRTEPDSTQSNNLLFLLECP